MLPPKGSYKTDSPPTFSIVDSNPMLINFCKSLESTFRHGAIHEDKRNKFELIDLLLHITRKQNLGNFGKLRYSIRLNLFMLYILPSTTISFF